MQDRYGMNKKREITKETITPDFPFEKHMYSYVSKQKNVLPKSTEKLVNQLRIELEGAENELFTLRDILSSFPDPILITTEKRTIEYANSAWEKETGYTLSEVIGKKTTFLDSRKTPKHVYKSLQKTLKEQHPFTSEEFIKKRKDGSEFVSRSTIFPIYKDQKCCFYVEVLQNITERKKDQELKNYLALLVQTSQDAIIASNKEHIITSWNPVAEKLFGYTAQEAIGKPMTILYPTETIDKNQKMMNTLRRGKTVRGLEMVRKRKDGSLVTISLTKSPIKIGGKIMGFSAVARDITEQRRIENLKTEFLSVASHELKTPITTLTLMAEVLQKKITDKNHQKHLLVMEKELKRLTELIDDLLDISRIETGKLHFAEEKVDLEKFTAHVVHKMRLLAGRRKIHFSSHVSSHTETYPFVSYVDPHRIEQVLTNLITNAIKYSRVNTLIEVSIQRKKNNIIISVKDEGEGIKKENIKQLFDRFYQGPSKAPTGFGLGLYVAKEIMEKHKGKIWVESEFGKGSTFFISLPIKHQKS